MATSKEQGKEGTGKEAIQDGGLTFNMSNNIAADIFDA